MVKDCEYDSDSVGSGADSGDKLAEARKRIVENVDGYVGSEAGGSVAWSGSCVSFGAGVMYDSTESSVGERCGSVADVDEVGYVWSAVNDRLGAATYSYVNENAVWEDSGSSGSVSVVSSDSCDSSGWDSDADDDASKVACSDVASEAASDSASAIRAGANYALVSCYASFLAWSS